MISDYTCYKPDYYGCLGHESFTVIIKHYFYEVRGTTIEYGVKNVTYVFFVCLCTVMSVEMC